MSKRGRHTPITDEEAEDFARRMAESGATEVEIRDRSAWADFVDKYMRSQFGRYPSTHQAMAAERGRQFLFEHHYEAGVAIATGVRAGFPWLRYYDPRTGRWLRTADAYSRLKAVGASIPRRFF